MKEEALITMPESPYYILGVSYNAGPEELNAAMRRRFRESPHKWARIANIAQKKLSDPKERIKVDALCCELPLPEVSLLELKKLDTEYENLNMAGAIAFAEVYFSKGLEKSLEWLESFEKI